RQVGGDRTAEDGPVVLQRELRIGQDGPPTGGLDRGLGPQGGDEQPERGDRPQHGDHQGDRATDPVGHQFLERGGTGTPGRLHGHRSRARLSGSTHPRTALFLAIWRTLYTISGTTSTKIATAIAAPIPLLPNAKDHSNISLART